jgi:hypothetical protein
MGAEFLCSQEDTIGIPEANDNFRNTEQKRLSPEL